MKNEVFEKASELRNKILLYEGDLEVLKQTIEIELVDTSKGSLMKNTVYDERDAYSGIKYKVANLFYNTLQKAIKLYEDEIEKLEKEFNQL